jgi:hypothetical protein
MTVEAAPCRAADLILGLPWEDAVRGTAVRGGGEEKEQAPGQDQGQTAPSPPDDR